MSQASYVATLRKSHLVLSLLVISSSESRDDTISLIRILESRFYFVGVLRGCSHFRYKYYTKDFKYHGNKFTYAPCIMETWLGTWTWNALLTFQYQLYGDCNYKALRNLRRVQTKRCKKVKWGYGWNRTRVSNLSAMTPKSTQNSGFWVGNLESGVTSETL